MKKKTIINLSVLGAVIVLAVIASIILFAPKRLTNLVSLENIQSIKVRVDTNITELTGETKESFIREIENGKYKLRFQNCHASPKYYFLILYNDGTGLEICIEFDEKIYFNDVYGFSVKSHKVYILADLLQFVPPEFFE